MWKFCGVIFFYWGFFPRVKLAQFFALPERNTPTYLRSFPCLSHDVPIPPPIPNPLSSRTVSGCHAIGIVQRPQCPPLPLLVPSPLSSQSHLPGAPPRRSSRPHSKRGKQQSQSPSPRQYQVQTLSLLMMQMFIRHSLTL